MTAPHGTLSAADWFAPDWPVPPRVHALCTTRSGGVSQSPFDSLNLGTHVGDDVAAVQANRQRLQATLAASVPGTRAVFLNQVHGDGVVHLDSSTRDGVEADACVTALPGVACTIMVADCLPVLFAHRSGGVVAAAHAGWRGLAGTEGQCVLEAVFKRFEALAQVAKSPIAIKSGANVSQDAVAQDTLVWLGPCIGPHAFEVGNDVRAAFCGTNAAAQSCFVPSEHAEGKFLCDLAGLARLRLQSLGITEVYGNDSSPPWCTATNASRFFSHRRDASALGATGRLAVAIWLG